MTVKNDQISTQHALQKSWLMNTNAASNLPEPVIVLVIQCFFVFTLMLQSDAFLHNILYFWGVEPWLRKGVETRLRWGMEPQNGVTRLSVFISTFWIDYVILWRKNYVIAMKTFEDRDGHVNIFKAFIIVSNFQKLWDVAEKSSKLWRISYKWKAKMWLIEQFFILNLRKSDRFIHTLSTLDALYSY